MALGENYWAGKHGQGQARKESRDRRAGEILHMWSSVNSTLVWLTDTSGRDKDCTETSDGRTWQPQGRTRRPIQRDSNCQRGSNGIALEPSIHLWYARCSANKLSLVYAVRIRQRRT